MKTLKISLVAVLAAGFFASCGGGINKGDIKKTAELTCKYYEAQVNAYKNGEDALSSEGVKKSMDELSAWGKKLEEKYKGKKSDKAQDEKAAKIYEEEMGKCKVKIEDITKAAEEYTKKKMEEEMAKIAADTADVPVQ